MNLDQSCTITALGNGAATVWPFTFFVALAVDLDVRLVEIATGIVTVLNSGQYTLVLIGQVGGTVTYPISGPPLASTHKIIITRVRPYKQELDLTSGINLLSLEDQLDFLSMQIQQLKEKFNRVLLFPLGEVQPESVPSVTRALKLLSADAAGNLEFLRNVSDLDIGVPGPPGADGTGIILLSAVAGTNTVTATGTPTVTAYAPSVYQVIFANAPTGAVTLNVDGVGPLALLNPDGTALASGAYAAGVPYILICNGSDFRFLATF